MTTLKPRKRVLLALGWYSYRLHRGVARYADQARWILNAEMERVGQIPAHWDGDGAICVLGIDEEKDQQILDLNVPTVSIGPVIQQGVPRIFPDNELIGQQAAEHFLTRGFKHFAYYICSGGPSDPESFESFAKVGRVGRAHVDLPVPDRRGVEHLAWGG